MKKNDVYLRHVIDEINFVLKCTEDKTLDKLIADDLVKRAVERSFSVIGEAVAKISADLKERHSYIPWRQIKDFRNRIIHDYFDVDYEIMWQIIKNDLPKLNNQIEHILKEIQ